MNIKITIFDKKKLMTIPMRNTEFKGSFQNREAALNDKYNLVHGEVKEILKQTF